MGAEGTPRIVRRDESLRDNDALPEAIAERCGKKIYERLVNGFDRGEDFQVEVFSGRAETGVEGRVRDAEVGRGDRRYARHRGSFRR